MLKTKEEYWPSGRLKSKFSYNNNDKLHGSHESWDESGQLWVKSNYNNGQLDGLYESWYVNGQPWIKCNYNNDKAHGLYETWHEDGQQRVKYNYYYGTEGQPTSHAFQIGHLVSYVHDDKENIDCIVQKIEQCGYVMSSGHFVIEQNIKGGIK
ncbi:MAG: hypothetical protein KJ587_19850 [Alphaproteobacteria bacterium]|nr:hypothetical protein [Alphaproteobacteria bacterium]